MNRMSHRVVAIDDAAELSLLLRGADIEGHAAWVTLAVSRTAFETLKAFDLGPDLARPVGAAAMAGTDKLESRSYMEVMKVMKVIEAMKVMEAMEVTNDCFSISHNKRYFNESRIK